MYRLRAKVRVWVQAKALTEVTLLREKGRNTGKNRDFTVGKTRSTAETEEKLT